MSSTQWYRINTCIPKGSKGWTTRKIRPKQDPDQQGKANHHVQQLHGPQLVLAVFYTCSFPLSHTHGPGISQNTGLFVTTQTSPSQPLSGTLVQASIIHLLSHLPRLQSQYHVDDAKLCYQPKMQPGAPLDHSNRGLCMPLRLSLRKHFPRQLFSSKKPLLNPNSLPSKQICIFSS